MKPIVLIAAVALCAWCQPSTASDESNQHKFCPGIDPGKPLSINLQLGDGSEADCVTDEFAIEVDFTEDWNTAIGQVLHYAGYLKKRPGIILVCRSEDNESVCLGHKLRLVSVVTYWQLSGLVLWTCAEADANLAACLREEFPPN